MADERTEKSTGNMTTEKRGRGIDWERRQEEVRNREEKAAREAEGAEQRAREEAGEEVSEGEKVTQGAGWRTAEEWQGKRWREGEEILGRYVVEGELGQGGMGVVYKCLDKVGGVRVAVKALPPELSHNSVEMEEVRENFELVYKLSHPNIAGVRTLERDGRGEYFLVMEIAEGMSLRKWLREKWKAEGVSLSEAVPILRQVAAALNYAHDERVVHRDVKPGNVMIDGRGRVKVLDFGLAAQIMTSLSRASQAYRGTSGTGPYMAPEQWEAQPQGAQTDQYALGVMAYEMLSGHLPFDNVNPTVLREAVLKGAVYPIQGVSKRVMAAIRRALAKEPGKRFPNCGAFIAALEGETAKSTGHNPQVFRWLATVVLLSAIVAGSVGVGLWAGKKRMPESAGGEELDSANGAGRQKNGEAPEEEHSSMGKTEKPGKHDWQDKDAAILVDGEAILLGELKSEVDRMMEGMSQDLSREEMEAARGKCVNMAINNLITRRLLAGALARSGIVVSQDEVESARKSLENSLGDGQTLEAVMAGKNVSQEELESNLRLDLFKNKMLRGKFEMAWSEITDEHAKQYYDGHPEEFRRQDGQTESFAEAKERLKGKLKRNAQTRIVREYLEELRNQAVIQFVGPLEGIGE